MRNSYWTVLLAALALCVPVTASALTITVQVDGVVTFVDDDDGLLPIQASAGDAWRIVYVISAVAPLNSCDPAIQSGCYYGVIRSMTSTIAGQSYSITPTGEFASYQASENMSIFRNGDDRWSINGASGDGMINPPDIRVGSGIDLFGPGDSALVLDESYLPVPDFAFATRSLMSLTATRYFEDYSYDTDDGIRGRVSSIMQIATVPEPSTAWLMLAGVFGLVATARRPRPQDPSLA